MDEFKKQLRNRQLLLVAGLMIACSAVSLTRGGNLTAPDFFRGFIDGFQVGLLAALLGATIFHLIRNLRAMRDSEKLKKLYVNETDERKMFIQQKAGSMGFAIVLFGLVLATIVAGNYNLTVFFTLLGATVFVEMVGGFLKLFYHFKY